MNNPDNTGARVGVFFILVIVLGIVLLVTSITASPKRPVYLPMVARSVYPGPSQTGYIIPEISPAEKTASVVSVSLNPARLAHYQPARSIGLARQWL